MSYDELLKRLLLRYDAEYEYIKKRLTFYKPVEVKDFTTIKVLCKYLEKDVREFRII